MIRIQKKFYTTELQLLNKELKQDKQSINIDKFMFKTVEIKTF